MNDSGWNMYVFREGRKNVRGVELTTELGRWLDKMSTCPGDDAGLGALIAAGELECALADAGERGVAAAAAITDDLAGSLFGSLCRSPRELAWQAASIGTPETVCISVAEGFAYYALHPFRFQMPVQELATGAPVRVIGLRSIGTTLSAVVQALFRKHGCNTERITVRPQGHPYDRQLSLSDQECAWLRSAGADAIVVIVDEGPGLSGSSFLCVAEAVERAGIPASQIVMLGSRYPDCTQLRAPDAAHRWSRFRYLVTAPEPILPSDAVTDLSGGVWRHHFWADFENQPASWTNLEPAKYMALGRGAIYKFHGYGHFGEAIANRATLTARAGFGPGWMGLHQGFGKYELLSGRLLTAETVTEQLLSRAAEYCAFRARNLATSDAESSELQAMAKWNWQCEFGAELPGLRLPVEKPVICDGRMLPHEWILTDEGTILKLDSSSHGDDHFFPGPCDIAWDLAGMIVEWELTASQSQAFLQRYGSLSGDDAGARIADYVLAYAIFRMSWSKMAASASAGTFDEKLLLRDYMRYRKQAISANPNSSHQPKAEAEHTSNLNPAIAC